MELVKVAITVQAITARYGTLNPGDAVRTDAAYAKHLVEECMCGEYAKSAQGPAEIAAGTPSRRSKRNTTE